MTEHVECPLNQIEPLEHSVLRVTPELPDEGREESEGLTSYIEFCVGNQVAETLHYPEVLLFREITHCCLVILF